jgi:hypothetical protein
MRTCPFFFMLCGLMPHIFAKHLIGLMKSTEYFVLELITASVYVNKNWRNCVLKYCDSLWLSFKCSYRLPPFGNPLPCDPQFESINEIYIYILSLITLIMEMNYYESLELLFKTQRNWQIWTKCWTWHVSKKLPDSAAFSYIRIGQTSGMCQAKPVN